MKKILGFCSLLLLASAAWATPPNVAILDGRPIEYDSTDLRGTFSGASSWGAAGTLSNLYVTWDTNYLYIALQAWQASNNKLVVLLDVDPGSGTGATTTTNWSSTDPAFPGFIRYNDYGWVSGGAFGLDYMMASVGTYNNIIRINYDGAEAPTTNNLESLFDNGNGANPTLNPIDMTGLNDATACPHKGFEVRIPWTNLYAGTRFGTVLPGEKVPHGATLHLLAGIHNNDPAISWSSPDTIPNQTVLEYTNGILTTTDYLGVVVDINGDGIPDVGGGDSNAPWIRAASGAVGGTNVYVAFNEPVTTGTAENTSNWTFDGVPPTSAKAQNSHVVLLGLAAPIATNFVVIRATGVQDASTNARPVVHCLVPASSGIPQPVTVTFQVNTNSGMGVSSDHARPTAFFVNGASLPLEWGYTGYPPFETVQLTPIPGSNGWTSVDVTFLAGSPSVLDYKYSARISGTNNYEAIRLTDFASAARKLVLSTNGAPMTVVDYLGAAAFPLRNTANTNTPTAQNRLYFDPRRGDAGVRVRREILFQLDLSLRKHDNLQRVFVAGSDPLRGFNSNGETGPEASDYPGAYVTWLDAGVQLFDDGNYGDLVAGDGIYSRLWAFSTNGVDSAIEPAAPNSLVGGSASSEPYVGTWQDQRSPRSLIYKFYVYTDGGKDYESPSSNIEYYMADPEDATQIVLAPFVWDNDGLPPPPPSNAPSLTGVTLTGAVAYVAFENLLTETAHGVKISTNLLNGFDDYGLRATGGTTNGGVREWSAAVSYISGTKEYYAPFAGLEPDSVLYWTPNVIPATASTWRVYFSQFKTNLKGMRSMALTGGFAGWGNGSNMTFLGNGLWAVDIALPDAADGSGLLFKPRGGPSYEWFSGGDYKAVRGTGGVAWSPVPPVSGSPLTITLDVAGTPLAAVSNVNLHMGFDGWQDTSDRAMTNTSGTLWEYAFTVPSNRTVSVDWVFNNGTLWYSAGDWRAFMSPYYIP